MIRADQLAALGISRQAVSRWVARGRLRREHRGVYVYGNGRLDQDGRLYAAALAIGDDAALAREAAALHAGFWPYGPPARVDVVLARHVRSRRGIRVHTVAELAPEAVVELRGVRMTTPARTVRDLAGSLRSDRGFRRTVHEAQAQGMLSFAALAAEVDRAPANVPGRARLLAELAAGPTPTRSGFEEWAVELLRAHRFPRFETNAHPPGVPPWVEVDVLFGEPRVVIELDGERWHATPWRRERDAYKRALLAGAGYTVLVLGDEDARAAGRPGTVARIRQALEGAI